MTMVTPYQITATGGRRRLCDVRMNQRRELTKRKSFAASQLLRAREVCTMSKVMNFRYSLLLISSLFFFFSLSLPWRRGEGSLERSGTWCSVGREGRVRDSRGDQKSSKTFYYCECHVEDHDRSCTKEKLFNILGSSCRVHEQGFLVLEKIETVKKR